MLPLVVESISVRGFRNLVSVDVDFCPQFNVISGDNGQGKTNLLESVYAVATSRSFRTSKLGELIGIGGETASARARIREGAQEREQSLGLRRGLRAVRIDGKRPPTLAAYAVRTPTVVFHPGAVALSAGAGSERRTLLDRIALYISPSSITEAASYAKATRARQRVLEMRGDFAADLDGWEELIVRHGSALSAARQDAAEALMPAAENAFARIGAPRMALEARYRRNAPVEAEAFRSELVRHRARDRVRRSASVGPHRDDLVLTLAGLPVRGIASQGQHRAVVLALELAEIEVIAAARGVQPILLLDDVSSELDRERTVALLSALHDRGGQVVLTTARPELIDHVGREAGSGEQARRDFRVVSGQVAVA